jgi:predicted O-methyltransferase YrrM
VTNFSQCEETFDLIFIDGLHEAAQVTIDIQNSLRRISPRGTVVCHDVNPKRKAEQTFPRRIRHWTGDCWKAFVRLRQRPDLCICTVDYYTGYGIIRRGLQVPIRIPKRPTYD